MSGTAPSNGQNGVAVSVECPSCHIRVKITKPELFGKRVACPGCKNPFVIPAPSAGAKSAPASQLRAAAATTQRNPQANPRATAPATKQTRPAPSVSPYASDLMSDLDALGAAAAGGAPAAAGGPLRPMAGGFPAAKKKKQSMNWQIPALIGGAAVVVLAMVAVGVVIMTSGSSTPVAVATRPPVAPVATAAPATSTTNTVATTSTATPNPAPPVTPPTPPVATSSTPAAPMVNATPAPPATDKKEEEPAPAKRGRNKRPAKSPPKSEQKEAKGSVREIVDSVQDGIVRIKVLNRLGKEVSFGSGFLVDDTGRVATNYHVVDAASRAIAQFRDGTEIEINGYWAIDRGHDLAIMQLEKMPKKFHVLELNTSTDPSQGDKVVAMGHPRGFNFTVSEGIVSAVRSNSELPEGARHLNYDDDSVWIQTTAAISGGNSGGPLLNEAGQVIGLNTWISLAGSNLAFAIHHRHLSDLLGKLPKTPKKLPVPGGPASLDPLVADVVADLPEKFQDWFKQINRATNMEDRKKAAESGPIPIYMEKLFAVADSNRRKPAAFQALTFACELSILDPTPKAAQQVKKATDRLVADHLNDKELGEKCVELSRVPHAEVRTFLAEVSQKSSLRDVKGMATLGLGISLINDRGPKRKKGEAQAVNHFKKVSDEYGDVKLNDVTLGEIVGPYLFELEHLAEGKKAADIEGTDLEGEDFKLSDYKGKIVIINFFADWIPASRKMYSHLQKLSEKYKEDDVVVLGISIDPFDNINRAVKLKKVTWRCFWDGPERTISKQWNVSRYPMFYVIDHKGTIRFRDLDPEDLEQAIEVLLEDVAKKKKRSRRDSRTPA